MPIMNLYRLLDMKTLVYYFRAYEGRPEKLVEAIGTWVHGLVEAILGYKMFFFVSDLP